jgi:hypothetical protein
MATVRRHLAALLLSLVAGCGEGLIDREYRGIPIFQIKGNLSASDGTESGAPMRIALFYSPDALTQKADSEGAMRLALSQLIEDTGTTITVQAGQSYTLNIYEPPAPQLRARSPSGGDAGFAAGRIMAYLDENRDGRRQPEEPFLGTEPSAAYIHVPSPLPSEQSPTQRSLPAGFFQLLLPQLCTFAVPAPNHDGSCDVELGRQCVDDFECTQINKAANCLKETNFPWPGGYCVMTLPENPNEVSCRPRQASLYLSPASGARLRAARGYYMHSCTTDADCAEEGPRYGLYVCDTGLQMCRPSATTMVRISGPDALVQFESFCPSSPMPLR